MIMKKFVEGLHQEPYERLSRLTDWTRPVRCEKKMNHPATHPEDTLDAGQGELSDFSEQELEEEGLETGGHGVEVEDVEGDSARIDEPFDPTLIKIDTKPQLVDLVIRRINRNEIDLNPDFQRNPGVWDRRRQSRLIESLLLRIPLPVFYMAADRDDNWQVVDGLQRLDALKGFVLEKSLHLRGLEYLHQFEGQTYDQLPRAMQRRVDETELSCHVIQAGTPPEVMFNVFKRINTGGKPLTPQEIRHALNPGKARNFINDLALCGEFLDATGRSISPTRMADRECILRFIAFYSKELDSYKGDLDAFLIKAMKDLNEDKDQFRLDELRSAFRRAMRLASALFGSEAFRKPQRNMRSRSLVNKPLFESWSVNLARIPEEQNQLLEDRKDCIREGFRTMMDDKVFVESITFGTQTIRQVRKRFQSVEDLLNKVR